MFRQRFILPSNRNGNRIILASYNGQGGVGPDQRFTRDDKSLAFQIEPVIEVVGAGGAVSYIPDYDASDTFAMGIGTPDELATGGTFTVTVVATTSNDLPYNITAANLETVLNDGLVFEGLPLCDVTELGSGAFRLDARTDGAILDSTFSADGVMLQPQCDAFFTAQSLGAAGEKYHVLFVIRQSPVAYAEPAAPLPAAGVDVDDTQAGSASANKIQTVFFTADNTYGGSFNVACETGALQQFTSSSIANPTVITFPTEHGMISGDSFVIPTNNGSTPTIAGTHTVTYLSPTTISIPVTVTVAGTVGYGYHPVTATCGVATPGMTAEEFGTVLAGHPVIHYKESGFTDNVSVKVVNGAYVVTFTGDLGASDIPNLVVSDIDLLAPQGVSGTIDLNTIALYYRSLQEASDVFSLYLEIRRTRTTGEIRTLLQVDWKIAKEIIDVASMVPVPRPNYLTEAVADERYWLVTGDTVSTGTKSINGANETVLMVTPVGAQTAANANALAICNKDGTAGNSAMRFLDENEDEMGAVGFSNAVPDYLGFPYGDCIFVASHPNNPDGSINTTNPPKAIRVILGGNLAGGSDKGSLKTEWSPDGNIKFWANGEYGSQVQTAQFGATQGLTLYGNGEDLALHSSQATGDGDCSFGLYTHDGSGVSRAGFFGATNSTYGYLDFLPNSAYFGADRAGGLRLFAGHASGEINFYTGGYSSSEKRVTISSALVAVNVPLHLGESTVAGLPTPPGGVTAYATVTDALLPTYLGALTGGGAVKCPVFFNGSAWVSA